MPARHGTHRNGTEHRSYHRTPKSVNPRLTSNQTEMLIQLIAHRINQMTSLALIRNQHAMMRRQWQQISDILSDSLAATQKDRDR